MDWLKLTSDWLEDGNLLLSVVWDHKPPQRPKKYVSDKPTDQPEETQTDNQLYLLRYQPVHSHLKGPFWLLYSTGNAFLLGPIRAHHPIRLANDPVNDPTFWSQRTGCPWNFLLATKGSCKWIVFPCSMQNLFLSQAIKWLLIIR